MARTLGQYPIHPPILDVDRYFRHLEDAVRDEFVMPELLYWTPSGARNWCRFVAHRGRSESVVTYPLAHQARETLFRHIEQVLDSLRSDLQYRSGTPIATVPTVVSLGPGEGRDDVFMIPKIRQEFSGLNHPKLHYYLYDISFPMLERACMNIRNNGLLCDNVCLRWIHAGFSDIESFRTLLHSKHRAPVLFCLLGHTLGNFSERSLLSGIAKTMSEADYFLLGVDCAADHYSSEEITRATSESDEGEAFLNEPIYDLAKTYKLDLKILKLDRNSPLSYETLSEGMHRSRVVQTERLDNRKGRSDVLSTLTSEHWWERGKGLNKIVLSVSHKYKSEELKKCLSEWFEVVREFVPTDGLLETAPGAYYSLLLLRKHSRDVDEATVAAELRPLEKQKVNDLKKEIEWARKFLSAESGREDEAGLAERYTRDIDAGRIGAESLRGAYVETVERRTAGTLRSKPRDYIEALREHLK